MTRVRTDNVFGTLTDNPLTSGATTMNSAGLANLAVVSSAEAIIILDPNRVSGAPEIVVVTAHTGSATSATIQRGQFGTTARQHAQGTEWVHGPIASNASTYATAADDQGDFVPMNAWETWAPVISQPGTITATVTFARYVRHGRTITAVADLAITGAGTGGNTLVLSLPVTAASASGIMGSAWFLDTSASTKYVLAATGNGTVPPSVIFVHDTSGANFFGVGPNVALASGDTLRFRIVYEAAS